MEWRIIRQNPTYKVSSTGIVKRVDNDRELVGMASHRGHLKVKLYSGGGVYKPWFIHRLVATEFIPNPNNYPVIDHIDRCPSNNNVENLKWATRSHNTDNTSTPKSIRIKYLDNNKTWIINVLGYCHHFDTLDKAVDGLKNQVYKQHLDIKI